jgi:glucose/arabinose dehydrogenase
VERAEAVVERPPRAPRGAAVAVAVVAALTACAGAVASERAVVTVRVDARDFSFKLSRRSVPAGTTVRFVVRNRGAVTHDFVIRGRRTRVLAHGATQTIAVTFPRKGTFRFLCSLQGHARLGMKGAFAVAQPPPPEPPPEPPAVDVSSLVRLTKVGTFERPVHVAAPADDGRIFVVEQAGTVKLIKDGVVQEAPFLDIRDRVTLVSETGLLSLAFAPDYATSGRAYVFYNDRVGNGNVNVVEYRRTTANPDLLDPGTARQVLNVVKPWENHNGGMLQFGPDGYLYVSVGDGDSGVLGPPGRFAQTRDDLLGNILRIDPRGGDPYAVPADNPFVGMAGVRPEIWAYGLRNPWRFWIDPPTGTMLIGDVGLGQREEIDIALRGQTGRNFGWPCFEGGVPFDGTATCVAPVPPLVDIPREGGLCAVIGGVVVRDPRLPALDGRYLYGDFCGERIAVLTLDGEAVARTDDLGVTVPQLESFGVDGLGRVYVVSLAGDVFRLDPAPAS